MFCVAGYIDIWIHSPRLALPLATAISVVLLRLHPRPLNPTPTFEFTTCFMGVMLGVCGSITRCAEFYSVPIQLGAVWARPPLWALRRLLVGELSACLVISLQRMHAPMR